MAQEEPLYDFPEPTQPSERKLGNQRGHGSLRSISVLDRLLLTVPVWLQLSINPATALHILQREPPGLCLWRPQPSASQISHDSFPSTVSAEFWNSHLNIRGPRGAPKTQEDKKKKPKAVNPVPPTAAPQTSSAAQSDSVPEPDSANQLKTAPKSDTATKQSGSNPTLFHEFCPITTRSPGELDYGSSQGALCFINPLFLQSQNALSRRRMFKHSLKVRISTESSTLLSPPLAPPPPPPLMPKTKRQCKAQKPGQGTVHPLKGLLHGENSSQDTPSEARVQPPTVTPHLQPKVQEQGQTQMDPGQMEAGIRGDTTQLPTVMENLPDDSDYMQPSPMINFSLSPSLPPYLSTSVSRKAPPLFPKVSPSLFPHDSPGSSPPLSPHQPQSLSPKAPFSLSPYDSPSASPSLSPYQTPSPSLALSPSFPQLAKQAYHTPATPSRPDQPRSEREAKEEGAGVEGNKDEDVETNEELHTKRDEEDLVLQRTAASVNDTDSCSSFSSLEGAAETPPHSPHQLDNGTSL
ncbi:proline-rich protein 36 isoform X2 [Etheostoma spectabile]|uniref:proline-rich protein 36 isoform X2 n=1 Tax=Etheostoma spectabile TaxID=54343 RepID=UPI0013AF5D5B|nr:proline-rich protein 36-like isoform X2 [Etheostoma spectabile]XP_032390093.1 proline-rich protein 36-like isoform X2 [Etheostoma spectabile]